MKTFRILAPLAVLAAGILSPSASVRAQDAAPVSSLDTQAQTVVKQKPVKPVWLKAEVIHCDQISLLVREEHNGMMIHAFTYSDKARAEMQGVFDSGGFQYGDKIKIRYMPGKTEALDIRGVASKPL